MSDAAVSSSATSPVLLSAVGLEKRYGRTLALAGVSLQARPGEVLCVIGPNGAGKTTLIQLLAGIVFPSAGHVTVFGLHRWKDNFAIRQRSTVLLADPIVGASPTPYEFLRFMAQIYGMPKERFLERTETLAREMALLDHLHKGWEELSLGMTKKAGLIGCFLPPADLRILDEPFAGGIDPIGMEALYRWMDAARGRGETIVFSTQVLDQADQVSDRLLVLREGELVANAAPEAVIRQAGVDPAEPRALARAFVALTGGGGEG
ncbi:MAG: ABC transporter ATP-binding protein [Sumerlaeia bacterium]